MQREPLFQWNSADHVPYSQSEQPLPASPSTLWDWFHINAVHIDTDGNLLIDARNTWTAYKVNRFTGQIIWQLGGKASSFTLQAAPGQSLDNAGEIFTWQHDPEAVGHDEYTFFDNESAGTPEFSSARAVTVRLQLTQKWIKRGAHRSVKDLVASIRTWITNWNENPTPYVWHKTADEILTTLADYCQRISDSGH